MFSRNLVFLFVLPFLCFVPQIALGKSAPTSAELFARIAELQKMLATLQSKQSENIQKPISPKSTSGQVIGTLKEWEFARPYNTVVVSEKSENSEAILDDWDELTVFTVRNEQLENSRLRASEIAKTNSYKVWQLFVSMSGKDFVKKHLNEYMTYDLSDEPTLAFVDYISGTEAPWMIYKQASTASSGKVTYGKHNPGWGLAVNLAEVDFNDRESMRELIVTLLHEYGHILTLNSSQISYNMSIVDQMCKREGRYIVPEDDWNGCTKLTSYLQTFTTKFWSKNDAANGSNFVTRYASTNPREDIAESFTNFVLQGRPTSVQDVGDEKIEFFYNYPELVTLRSQIRSNIAKYFE